MQITLILSDGEQVTFYDVLTWDHHEQVFSIIKNDGTVANYHEDQVKRFIPHRDESEHK